jgi:predicted nucleotidyltransferase
VTRPLDAQQQLLMQRIADALRGEPAVAAIGLGGSFARGHATGTSDIDLVLFYDQSRPPTPSRLDAIVAALSPDATPVFTSVGEWGPWVNGGAWLRFAGQRIDVLYRSLQQCQRVLDDCAEGRWELHWAQQPPYGYFSPTFVEELEICVPLFDRSETLTRLRAQAKVYPEALRRRIVQDFLWSIEFGLDAFVPKYVAAADAYGLAGCASRICFQLVQVVYALNRRWPPPDRVALSRAASLSIAPRDFAARVRSVLAHIGADAAAQAESARRLRELWQETVHLGGSLYTPRMFPP